MTSSPPDADGLYHPVVHFPEPPRVLDLSTPHRIPSDHRYSIGRYNEQRAIYTQELFEGLRTIHVGIDLGAPAQTPVHTFADCTLYAFGINSADGDYGPTLVTEQVIEDEIIWALYGHLSKQSLLGKAVGQTLRKGELIGWIGSEEENGGWPPHVHFQLSRIRPQGHDMPGVVSPAERDQALKDYPDPRWVLGRLYS